MKWIDSAIMFPVPIIHFWLHALLPWWRKRPVLFYLWALLLFFCALSVAPYIASISPCIFTPSVITRSFGIGLKVIGALAILTSIMTIGIKRFFLWAVLKPESVPKIRIIKGPFKFVPHPAYFGYILLVLGNLLGSGALYLVGILAWLVAFLPLVIILEEKEIDARIGTKNKFR